MARWIVARLVQDGYEFPLGTIAVNTAGSLLLGFVMGAASIHGAFSRLQRLFLATGFAGAFTTFSTVMYESLILLREFSVQQALIYLSLTLLLGLSSLYAGYALSLAVYRP